MDTVNKGLTLNPITAAVMAALTGTSPTLQANPVPGNTIGTVINVGATGTKIRDQAIGMDIAGDSVVSWVSYVEGTGFNVFAQRYGLDGKPRGAVLQVSGTTAQPLRSPKIAMDAAGDFVIEWTAYYHNAPENVMVHRYSADGTSLADPSQANATNNFSVYGANTAMDAAGDFVLAWTGYDETSSKYVIYARQFAADGNAVAPQFKVNTVQPGSGVPVVGGVAADAAGDFVVVWGNYDKTNGDDADVYAQRFDNTGNAVGANFRVNTTVLGNQELSSVAMDATGDFVVAWDNYTQAGTNIGVFAQRFSANGSAAGSEFEVAPILGILEQPGVAMDAVGDFVVSWQSQPVGADFSHAFARRYTADGTAATDAFLIDPTDATPTNGQLEPAVAMDAAGDYMAVWASNGFFAQLFARESSLDLSADLALSPPDAVVSPGAGLTLTADVANNALASTPTGNAAIDAALTDATGVTATLTLSPRVSFVSASGTNWTCPDPVAHVLTCTYSTALAAGEVSQAITVDVTASLTPAIMKFSNVASGNQPDTTPDNNTVQAVDTNDVRPVAMSATLGVNRSTAKAGILEATDSDSLTLTYAKATSPSHGTLTLKSAGGYTYTPAKNYAGSDSFTFTASDGTLRSAPATISITVTEHAPVADNASFSVARNITHSGQLKGTDLDTGDSKSFHKVASPQHGRLTLRLNGSFTYTPVSNFKGNDSFTFRVYDGTEYSNTATVSITVD